MNKLNQIISEGKRPFYKTDIIELLQKLHVESGDEVILHASLSSLGYLVGGEQTLIQTIIEYIGKEGTLVMPTQTVCIMNPNLWEYPPVPESWHDKIRDSIYAYDKDLSTVDIMEGTVARYFATCRGAVRSNHPLYSFTAYGKKAVDIVKDHNYDYGLGETSPLGKLYKLNAKVLMIGTDFDSNTSIHLAEYFLNREDIIENAPVLLNGKKEWIEFKNIELDVYDDFTELQKEYMVAHAEPIYSQKLYKGEALCFKMRDCVDYAIEYYKRKESLS